MEITVPKSEKVLTSAHMPGYSYKYEKEIVIPEGIREISEHTFSEFSITKIIFPKSLKKIGNYAFSKCTRLKEIILPDELEEIGDFAFYECDELEYVRLPRKIKKIGKCAFDTSRFVVWYERTPTGRIKTKNGLSVSHSYTLKSKFKRVFLPSSLVEIGERAFGSNELSYFVPWHSEAAKFAFEQSDRVVEVVSSKGLLLGSPIIDTTLFYDDQDRTSVIIPETVKKIAEYAFYDSSLMHEVILSTSLTEIGACAFGGCKNLKSVSFSTDSQLKKVGEHAFWGCENIEELIVPKSVTELGAHAFSGCKNLKSVSFETDSQLKKSESVLFWIVKTLKS